MIDEWCRRRLDWEEKEVSENVHGLWSLRAADEQLGGDRRTSSMNAMTDPGVHLGTHWESLDGKRKVEVDVLFVITGHARLRNLVTGRRHWITTQGLVNKYRELA